MSDQTEPQADHQDQVAPVPQWALLEDLEATRALMAHYRARAYQHRADLEAVERQVQTLTHANASLTAQLQGLLTGGPEDDDAVTVLDPWAEVPDTPDRPDDN